MTDEEMAEEYLKDDSKWLIEDNEGNIINITKKVKEAFLAGLNARRKWHKVADGDLPKIGKPCIVYLVNDDVITARLREDNVWTTNGHNAFENVIAWCEKPQLKLK